MKKILSVNYCKYKYGCVLCKMKNMSSVSHKIYKYSCVLCKIKKCRTEFLVIQSTRVYIQNKLGVQGNEFVNNFSSFLR